jgi:DNA polymerase alpha subunit A
MQFKYGDTELYTQLRYFATLFDMGKIAKAAQGSAKKGEHQCNTSIRSRE